MISVLLLCSSFLRSWEREREREKKKDEIEWKREHSITNIPLTTLSHSYIYLPRFINTLSLPQMYEFWTSLPTYQNRVLNPQYFTQSSGGFGRPLFHGGAATPWPTGPFLPAHRFGRRRWEEGGRGGGREWEQSERGRREDRIEERIKMRDGKGRK